ncbi:MAG: DNA-directed RNA polymerase subunit B, partial [Nanoarchaeota archaeon]
MSEVYVNGKYVGDVEDPKSFISRMIDERRKNAISSWVNVNFDQKTDCVFVETSKGRLRRPLIVVEEGKSLLTEKHIEQLEKGEIAWTDLIKQGIIEYLDAAEEENAFVALQEADLTDGHTHLEITPLDMLGLVAGLVPYGNFNQSTRLNAGAKNQKQALGLYASNYPQRFDTDVSLLVYPEVPVVQSIMHEISDYDKHPAGQNVTVAIISYKGYNM